MATHAGVALELGIVRPTSGGLKMMSPQMEAILIWCQCRVREYEVGKAAFFVLFWFRVPGPSLHCPIANSSISTRL